MPSSDGGDWESCERSSPPSLYILSWSHFKEWVHNTGDDIFVPTALKEIRNDQCAGDILAFYERTKKYVSGTNCQLAL